MLFLVHSVGFQVSIVIFFFDGCKFERKRKVPVFHFSRFREFTFQIFIFWAEGKTFILWLFDIYNLLLYETIETLDKETTLESSRFALTKGEMI